MFEDVDNPVFLEKIKECKERFILNSFRDLC